MAFISGHQPNTGRPLYKQSCPEFSAQTSVGAAGLTDSASLVTSPLSTAFSVDPNTLKSGSPKNLLDLQSRTALTILDYDSSVSRPLSESSVMSDSPKPNLLQRGIKGTGNMVGGGLKVLGDGAGWVVGTSIKNSPAALLSRGLSNGTEALGAPESVSNALGGYDRAAQGGGEIAKSAVRGVGAFGEDTVTGVTDAVAHPVNTVVGLGKLNEAVESKLPVGMAKSALQSVFSDKSYQEIQQEKGQVLNEAGKAIVEDFDSTRQDVGLPGAITKSALDVVGIPKSVVSLGSRAGQLSRATGTAGDLSDVVSDANRAVNRSSTPNSAGGSLAEQTTIPAQGSLSDAGTIPAQGTLSDAGTIGTNRRAAVVEETWETSKPNFVNESQTGAPALIQRTPAEISERAKSLTTQSQTVRDASKAIGRVEDDPVKRAANFKVVEEALSDPEAGPLTYRNRLGGGMNTAEVLLLDNGASAVWKPVSGESKMLLRDNVRPGTQTGREKAAYIVDKAMGHLGNVPPVVERTLGGERGIVMSFVDDAQPAIGSKAARPLDPSSDGYRRMAILDNVIGNVDRHSGNWMVNSKGEPIPIDHGLAFPTKNGAQGVHAHDFKEPVSLKPSDRQSLNQLLSQRESLTTELSPLLEQSSIDAMFSRVETMLDKGSTDSAWRQGQRVSRETSPLRPNGN